MLLLLGFVFFSIFVCSQKARVVILDSLKSFHKMGQWNLNFDYYFHYVLYSNDYKNNTLASLQQFRLQGKFNKTNNPKTLDWYNISEVISKNNVI